MCTEAAYRSQALTEVERLETELQYYKDNDYDSESHAYKETERMLHEAYECLDNL